MFNLNNERIMAWVARIDKVEKHPDADSLDVCTVGGWKCVTRLGEFQEGDLAVYCSIDSFIPSSIAPFLSKGKEPKVYQGVSGERLKTAKLRGIISQGLLLPLDVIPGHINHWNEGDDCSQDLGIIKYEPPIPISLAGLAKGSFPSMWRKTDQDRIQNFSNEEFGLLLRHEYEVSTKLDGSSCSFGLDHDLEYTVCSRNINLKLDQEKNLFVDTCSRLNVKEILEEYGKPIQICAELVGPGVQGNKEQLDKHNLFVFDIFDPISLKYWPSHERLAFCERVGLNHVPVIGYGSLQSFNIYSIDDAIKFADGPSLNAKMREGVVFKELNGGPSFKAISNNWLLKFD